MKPVNVIQFYLRILNYFLNKQNDYSIMRYYLNSASITGMYDNSLPAVLLHLLYNA